MWSNRDPNLNVWSHLETLFVSAGVEVASLSIDTVIYIYIFGLVAFQMIPRLSVSV